MHAANNGDKGDVESELKGILKDNLNHCFICALVCLIVIVLLRDGFFTMCFVGFCCAAIVNAIWMRRIDSGKGRELIESCKKNDVAYFLTLHYFTYDRTRKALLRIEREGEAMKSVV